MNRAEIRTMAEVRSDTDGSEFPTTAQKNLIIDDEARKLYSRMVNHNFPARRLVQTVTATGLAASIPLSVPRLLRLCAVRDMRYNSSGYRGAVRRANNLDRNQASTSTDYPYALSEIRYDIELDPATGWSIQFFPTSTSGDFSVEAIQGYPGFTNDTTEWYGPDPSAQCIALASALRFKQKEDETQGRALRFELEEYSSELWQVVQSLAPPMQMEDWVSLEEAMCQS